MFTLKVIAPAGTVVVDMKADELFFIQSALKGMADSRLWFFDRNPYTLAEMHFVEDWEFTCSVGTKIQHQTDFLGKVVIGKE